MKNLLFNIALMFSLCNSQAQIIPNAGFENWTNFGTYSDPTGWASLNSQMMGTQTCEQGTPGGTGNSFLKLTVKTYLSAPWPGVAILGQLNANWESVPNFACTTRYANLTGKWKYLVSPGDTSIIAVYFSKWNAALMQREDVGGAELEIYPGTVANWSNFSIPITYSSNDYPDTAMIYFVAGVAEIPIPGDYLYIDDINFTGIAPAGLEDWTETTSWTIGPNPFTQFTTLSFPENQQKATMNLYNVLGTCMRSAQFSGMEYRLERGNLTEGIYVVQIIDQYDHRSSRRIIIQ